MYKQYELPYAYDSMEDVLDALTMETHYSKHHATYTANLNEMVKKAGLEDAEITDLLVNLDQIEDENIRTGIRNNGGGFYNHNLYFEIISPNGGGKPVGKLAEKIEETFGDYETLVEKISALAISQFGSGWAWISVSPEGELVLSKTSNQDNSLSLGTGNTPIFALDVWEHAYYLKYKNLRAKYVDDSMSIPSWAIRFVASD